MITFSSVDINEWLITFLWPLARILALLAATPVLGNAAVPARVKIGLGMLITLVIAPTIGPLPKIDPASLEGLLVLSQQILIGVAMGFAMRIVFSAVEMAGEIAGLQMGLGFATFFSAHSDGSTLVVGKFLGLLATLAFLSVNGHLLVLSVLAESFNAFPVSAEPFSVSGWKTLADWGSKIFLVGLKLALPIVASLLIVNLALGILTRAAPQLNIFAVGFPITLIAGMVALIMSLPYFIPVIEQLVSEGLQTMLEIADAARKDAPAVPGAP
ncbi:flagellar biosynthetic protein FliR [Nitrosovibrio tenuis]|uniref:Flagellar biosynthetic protein FliR n=1 Tax=Nitrosovibrio tenuis TaxID=1233 RepID=A0A1H7J273_9PROT|nr:flagellar biosynthetic protein FliR [Nitrosovibrio tenuis]SEK68829.1 flagellar biosynthetic protein FliR [Nitrosovibrio tenuis]